MKPKDEYEQQPTIKVNLLQEVTQEFVLMTTTRIATKRVQQETGKHQMSMA